MAHLAEKTHLDKETIARVNSALVFGLIGSGLAVCVFGAAIFDLGRMLAVW